ncbi:hypothetical protein PHAVU_007G207500 [Phaseolus vulgaris]|uniref:Knotted 1-binding protein n=1 Tax=Phaseolus vulgaris TaxID=3885 RepID=V7BGQ5_PHAVU|nr:hypothetical protein PHAVU_007G207500g [Phaseolus vulgaris]XP_007145075.1 hypothetical protein PHAVU_007G207500g [Phaseolus vulgaris]XP_007145076.1 hypothetical protein PHAVU_007G207500g [Phaseolus vulgaris]ESW17068.1 hypothetical protein PHAVU_007G207500g [Phaseolus vulgaris]ESW17069.1 hypothetical protein PHAVU_007G207500g [Phaseolus vulgaris]ESW17070.1 hypothetical protein PHAVU_007G207500g [Phaseolus vulgaris]
MSTLRESTESGATRKRMKPEVEEKVGDEAESKTVEEEQQQEFEADVTGSEEMELSISLILEKIENYTQRVSELLESGKTMLRALSDEFEGKIIMIHKHQVEKWQEEIRELRALDASNEEANALLHNARYLLQPIRDD